MQRNTAQIIEYQAPERKASNDDKLLKHWLAKQRSVNTRREYEREARRFIELVGLPLARIDDPDLLAPWLAVIGKLAPGSQRRAINAIRSLMRYGQDTGRLRYNMAAAVPLPQRSNVNLAAKIVVRDEVIRLIDSETDPRRRFVLSLFYKYGFRVSELCGATWDQVSTDGQRWYLSVLGKGERWRTVQLTEADSEGLLAFGRPAADTAVQIVGVVRSTVWRWVKRLGKLAGYPQISPHTLRHCCVSHLLDASVPVHEVQQLVGHSSLATTAAYAHVRPETCTAGILEWK